MADVFGIEKSKAAVGTILDVINQAVESSKDGWQFTDLLSFIGYTGSINDLIKSFPQIKKEIGDWSEAETTEFYNFFAGKFNLPNAGMEKFIEHVIDYGIRTAAHVKEGVGLVAEMKALKTPPVTPP